MCDLNHRLAISEASVGRNCKIGTVQWNAAFGVYRLAAHGLAACGHRAI